MKRHELFRGYSLKPAFLHKVNTLILTLLFSSFFISCQAKIIKENAEKQNTEKPNIILINIDDMGWCDVGFMGSQYYDTPNVDALADEGMIFTQAYSTASNCAPSRACMNSGQYTPRHGIYTVNSSSQGKSKNRKLIPTHNTTTLEDSNYILAEALKDAGYTTCHAGKWHLGDDPTTQGFDVNIGGCHAGNPGSYYPPYKKVPLEAPSDDYYLTNLIMDKTIEFVNSVEDKPFFLNYSPYAVHGPFHPVDSLLPKYESKPEWNGRSNAKYATMVENVDIQIGRLIATLKESDKLKNTFIIFTSDNGGLYNKNTKQWPLRAGKGSYYEGGVREPMFVYWQDIIQPGTKSDFPVSNIDFYPTLLETAGVSVKAGKILDGESIYPIFMRNEQLNERPLFWHFPIYLQGGNDDSQDQFFRTRPGSAIRLGDWKLIQYFENNDLELYNLKDDIGEKNNLAEKNPEKVEELLAILKSWQKKTNAPIPTELNPDYNPG